MNKKELEIMIAFKECGTITDAAKKIGVSRSNASRTLKKIEEEFKTNLFIPTSNGVIPTFAGEIYLKTAKEILDLYNQMLDNL